jgi:hypothetical protein
VCGGACRAEDERRSGVEEHCCGLGEHERAVLGEELVQAQIGGAQRWMVGEHRGGGWNVRW